MRNGIAKDLEYALKLSASAVKRCFFDCDKKPIKAHSISNRRLLLKLSDKGNVMYCEKMHPRAGKLIEVGRGIATTFSGFCDVHDKIFLPIDNKDYEVGNIEQEFLFAMRTVAKELNVKLAAHYALTERIQGHSFMGYSIDTNELNWYKEGLALGVGDLNSFRSVFLDTFNKSKFNVIETSIIVAEKELPMAASSTFYIELSPKGEMINDLSPSAYDKKMKPCFMTVFPQDGKTYCLISYLRRYRKHFAFLQEIDSRSEFEKEVIISNLITVYTENFVANPSHWNNLSIYSKKRYYEIFESSILSKPRSFVFDESFNLFPAIKS